MFDVRGATIYFDGYPFGKVEGAPFVGLEIEAVNALLDWQDVQFMVSDGEYYEAVEKAEKEGYDSGHADGFEAGKEEIEKEKREQWETAAYEGGRRDALAEVERARDVEPVEAIVYALKMAHDALRTVMTKRYPAAKINEGKRTMRGAMITLRMALVAYEKSNGA